MRVLLVEDDHLLAVKIRRRLKISGLAVDSAMSLGQATQLVTESSYDCLVLDRTVPGGDSVDFVGKLRHCGNAVPIMIVSGCRTRPKERVAALEAGADDYLVQPLDLDELACRVLALCRRVGQVRSPLIQVGDLTIDSGRRQAYKAGRPLELTAREFTILEMLASRPGEVATRTELWEHCWGEVDSPYSNALNVHVGALRRKIASPGLIRTRRGIGYSVELP